MVVRIAGVDEEEVVAVVVGSVGVTSIGAASSVVGSSSMGVRTVGPVVILAILLRFEALLVVGKVSVEALVRVRVRVRLGLGLVDPALHAFDGVLNLKTTKGLKVKDIKAGITFLACGGAGLGAGFVLASTIFSIFCQLFLRGLSRDFSTLALMDAIESALLVCSMCRRAESIVSVRLLM